MQNFIAPTVRGENVTIIAEHSDDQKIAGVLNAVSKDAHILVSYPDGEIGYVKESQISDAA